MSSQASNPAAAAGPSKAPDVKRRKLRNDVIGRGGLRRYNKTAFAKKSGVWRISKKKNAPKKPAVEVKSHKKEPQTKPFQKGTRTLVRPRSPRVFPTPKPASTHKRAKPVKLRRSITRGTVLILLAGRYRGRRVVFLKQLPSGLLLVTGPFKLNGVPLRRVNQAYVIATSTKIPLATIVESESKIDDKYFKVQDGAKHGKKTEQHFFGQFGVAGKSKPSEPRAANQKAIDAPIVEAVKKVPLLKAYLKTAFSLKKGQYPHQLKF